jgi:RNA polymerase sigma factor (sigma-70 family)
MLVPAEERMAEDLRAAERDRNTLRRLRSREPGAAAAFYDRARPIIDAVLVRLLGWGDQEYEDMAQMALHELVVSLNRFDERGSFVAWTSVITARLVYRVFRRRRLERRIFSDADVSETLQVVPDASATFAARRVIAGVKRELDELNPNFAWTFLLHDVCGYDLREVAHITGATLAATQSRLSRGRRELHERIRNNPSLAGGLDGVTAEGD